MGRARHWTAKERALLREHYPSCGPQETSRVLAAHGYDDRGPRAVQIYANHRGLKWEQGYFPGPWSPEEEQILAKVYPSGGGRATSEALATAGYRRSHAAVVERARALGVTYGARKRGPKSDSPHRSGAQASPEILNRPLTADSIELIHFYAARGCSPERTAREINRTVEVVKRVLHEMKPAQVEPEEWWPAGDGMPGGRLPRYMTHASKQAQGLSA